MSDANYLAMATPYRGMTDAELMAQVVSALTSNAIPATRLQFIRQQQALFAAGTALQPRDRVLISNILAGNVS